MMLQLSPSAAEPWLWDLLEAAPLPAKAAKLSATRIRRILDRHRIRRLDAAKVQSVLAAPPLTLARGAAEAASEHALLLLPQLRLVDQQRKVLAKRIAALLKRYPSLRPAAEQGSIVTQPSFDPCREWEEKSPPRCSARPGKPSRNEITTLYAVW